MKWIPWCLVWVLASLVGYLGTDKITRTEQTKALVYNYLTCQETVEMQRRWLDNLTCFGPRP